MLGEADRALAERDPALPALPVLLDDHALQQWLAEHLSTPLIARTRYLRYKPGTSCVLGVEVCIGEEQSARTIVVTALTPGEVGKLVKTAERAPSASVLAMDHSGAMLVTTPAADRDLPALASLAVPRRREAMLQRALPLAWGDRGGPVRELAYKPQRRWVGRADLRSGTVLLRAYRPADLAAAAARIRALRAEGPRTPVLLGIDRRRGLAAVEFLPGSALTAPGAAELRSLGVALSTLHRSGAALPTAQPGDHREAVLAAADQLALLLPAVGPVARRIAAAATAAGGGQGWAQVPVHGDLSLDQAILGPDGEIALIDLDRAARGPAETDLASFTAEAHLRGKDAAAMLADVRAGYRLPVDRERLRLLTAGQLLLRAAEPFRCRRPDWAESTAALVAAADRVLTGGLERLEPIG
ncbi:hypothetical protein LQF12_04040 [Ruania suaedae]|uniref:hypothetical protein n=1 Tax=Ruania suaedae TaxID=2897774 RepID=UPI001E2DC6D2|nr:hypothetical protein [Ruania suaedae]UFU03791.1 hypothetical protein LQF12_04040 [Ruania suaedae]